MNCRLALEQIMKEKGIAQKDLAALVGMKRQTNVSEAFKRDMKVSLVARFADALGYELVLVKKKSGRKEDGRIKIDWSKPDESKGDDE